MEDYQLDSIHELDLAPYLKKWLWRHGIKTVGALEKAGDLDVLDIQNVGINRLQHIRAAQRAYREQHRSKQGEDGSSS